MIPIYKPYMPDNLLPDIEKILYSGNLAYGKYGKLFEQALADYTGNLNILTVSSYNHAMQIVLSTLGLQQGDEIIASPVSCLASNQPFVVKNLKIVWADVNPETGSMCPEDVKKRITSKTKAIFHNHFCGYLGQIDEIRKIGIEHNLIVVDDCIEAFGSEFNGKKMGSNESDIAVFSFQTVRLPNTIDGAAISFKNQNLYEKAKMIRDYGIDRSKFRDVNGEISAECDIEVEGYGALMSEINSLIGIKQMNDIDDLLKKQRQNAIVWNERIAESKQIVPLNLNKETNPNFWVYGVLCEDKKLALEEFRKKGWYATGVHINNNIYSVFKNSEKLIGVSKFMNQFLALPCGWWVQ
ncbi:dTDP-4-amino-4,6-dideoxygalactose transaminase [Flavobacterium resistens]|uniref:Aminotransferase class V-fold PLP-dependent enzyme n=1 Tax=Flavobacterium resistens TaxID=443612 RepID=A0A521ES56_9FLAO|nr:aminotransferase class V-fold PLP-dependent enzyme [Flavobacterium resistens]MRX67940.1 aminotransferase class V-fold PLP-dependent enzyme [Flavobacterium resistens]SMO86763.1 dTDP-4-amino-4,6-dideoxygalactose transaminase [Flavobacterium resistens]